MIRVDAIQVGAIQPGVLKKYFRVFRSLIVEPAPV
jgi:hypothetical protein